MRQAFFHTQSLPKWVVGAAIILNACAVAAQSFPNKPVRLVVASGAGGNADIIARLLGDTMAKSLGQPVIVENRGGASGIIGNNLVAKSAPDGYTLLFSSSTFAIVGAIANDLPYDPVRDFAGVGMVGATPILLVVNPGVPANSVKELIAYAKSNPGKLNFASSGNGSPAHLAGELFASLAKVKFTHVPYKGTAQGTTDTIGGTIQMAFPSMSSALGHVKSGKLKALGITSLKRSSIAPEISPVAETVPGYQATIWNGISAPAGTPVPVLARLNAELNKALTAPEVIARLKSAGVEIEASTPQEYNAYVEAEIRKWRSVIQESGIKVELAR